MAVHHSSGADRRINPRHPIRYTVTLSFDTGLTIQAVANNISRGGMFLWSEDPNTPAEAHVFIDFDATITNQDHQSQTVRLHIPGIIAHHVEGLGFGVEFEMDQLRDPTSTYLDQILSREEHSTHH